MQWKQHDVPPGHKDTKSCEAWYMLSRNHYRSWWEMGVSVEKISRQSYNIHPVNAPSLINPPSYHPSLWVCPGCCWVQQLLATYAASVNRLAFFGICNSTWTYFAVLAADNQDGMQETQVVLCSYFCVLFLVHAWAYEIWPRFVGSFYWRPDKLPHYYKYSRLHSSSFELGFSFLGKWILKTFECKVE